MNTDLRCAQCGGPLWELEWRWRIPKKNDDQGWRELEMKVAHDMAEFLPRRREMGERQLAEIDTRIETATKLKPSETRERRLKQLKAKRRMTLKKFTMRCSEPGMASWSAIVASRGPGR